MYLVSYFVVACVISTVICETQQNRLSTDRKMAIRYLQKYGYLKNDSQSLLYENMEILHDSIQLFQEYHRINGSGELNNDTINLMRQPRCGIQDFVTNCAINQRKGWPKNHLTWNFHLADRDTLNITKAAFDLWAANSSLTFERNILDPDIVLAYRDGRHLNINRKKNGPLCNYPLDGPGSILAHASFPSGEYNEVAEVHFDSAEKWNIQISENIVNTISLYHTLIHEVGHTLGLHHSDHRESVMYPITPRKPLPVKLSLEDILNIQSLYSVRDKSDFEPEITTPVTEITTTTTVSSEPSNMDLCAVRRVDAILILDKRLYLASEKYIWPIDINGKNYDKPLLLSHYMKFLPKHFTHITAVYQKPSGDLVLFVNKTIYIVQYPGYQLIETISFDMFGLPPKSRVNTAFTGNRGQSYVIYDDHIVGEIDNCNTRIIRHRTIQSVFPGIPHGLTMAFRYTDGNLYFIRNQMYYKFNEFKETITDAGKIGIDVIGVTCPRDGLLRQLRDLLNRLVKINNV